MDASELESALDALEANGVRLFDAASCDLVRALLSRADELGGSTGEILVRRAQGHFERLRARFASAREQARERLAAIERDHGVQPRLRDLLEIGDLPRLRRALRRLSHTPPGRAQLRRHESAVRASAYDESLAELTAALALARAVDVVPEHAGPYNPLRIASDLLARMRAVSPLYLTAQLNRLEELSALLTLPELPRRAPPPKPNTAAKKKRTLRS